MSRESVLQVTEPTVSAEHEQFARELAAVADKYGVDTMNVKYRVKGIPYGSGVREMSVDYTVTDGRGRPCKNLYVNFDCTVRKNIISTEPSYS